MNNIFINWKHHKAVKIRFTRKQRRNKRTNRTIPVALPVLTAPLEHTLQLLVFPLGVFNNYFVFLFTSHLLGFFSEKLLAPKDGIPTTTPIDIDPEDLEFEDEMLMEEPISEKDSVFKKRKQTDSPNAASATQAPIPKKRKTLPKDQSK